MSSKGSFRCRPIGFAGRLSLLRLGGRSLGARPQNITREPGRSRGKLVPAHEIAELFVEPILADLDFTGSPTIVFLNGLGGTPLIELYLLYGEVAALLAKAGVTVARSLVGPYMTSLDMAGASVTVLKADDEILKFWDAPVVTPGMRWGA